ncbi:hypothetical protein JL721_1081 [Aureococcus anophagefferens]|nr:hypothetical protein JL721_1081 [Aureococcus anophagefferens]
MGVGLGLLSLYLFCAEDPKALPKDTHGWPEVAALPLALSIIGSALSFLLVFRLSWAFNRWSEARSLMGATTTRLKRFSVLLHSQIGTDGGTPKQKLLLDECTVVRRAEIRPNFEILELGQIECLVSILKIAYTVFIFPQTMAYAFVMKLSSGHHEKFFIWRNPVYICAYLLITTLGVLFFTVMHLIALELDDPYGDDLSDLPMKQIHNALKADLEAIHHTALFRTLMSQHLDDDDDAVL